MKRLTYIVQVYIWFKKNSIYILKQLIELEHILFF